MVLLFVASHISREHWSTLGAIAAVRSDLTAVAVRAAEAERLTREIEDRMSEIERLEAQGKAYAGQAVALPQWNVTGTDDELFASWLRRIHRLATFIAANLSRQIPELAHLEVKDWLEATISDSLATEADFRTAAAKLRFLAKSRVAPKISSALAAYRERSGDALPAYPLQLLDDLHSPVAAEILSRYRMNPSGKADERGFGSHCVLVEDQQVDPIWYSSIGFLQQKGSYVRFAPPNASQLTDAISKFEEEHGRAPQGSDELAPYVKSKAIREHLDDILRAMATPVP